MTFDYPIGLEPETERWLKTVAETCLAHMKHVERSNPEDLEHDDHGLYTLDKAFLTLYALYVKGDIPRTKKNTH